MASNLTSNLTHVQRVTRLYRNALKHYLWYIGERRRWRTRALEVRAIFDANKDLRNPVEIKEKLEEGELSFELQKHPQPYYCTCKRRPLFFFTYDLVEMVMASLVWQEFILPALSNSPRSSWRNKAREKWASTSRSECVRFQLSAKLLLLLLLLLELWMSVHAWSVILLAGLVLCLH